MASTNSSKDITAAMGNLTFGDLNEDINSIRTDFRLGQHYPTRLSEIGEEDDASSCGSWQDVSDSGENVVALEEEQSDKAVSIEYEQSGKITEPSTDDCKAFFKAAIHGDIDMLQEKLDRGVDIEGETTKGFTALVIAIMEIQVDAVKFLLQKGADPSHRSRGLPPMVHALTRVRHATELMQVLLDHGVNLNTISGPDNKDVLHWAASEGERKAVEFLISRGMDLEKRCRRGRTPLLLAAECGHTEVAKILLQHGANLDVRSDNGGTPLIWSASNDHAETVKLWLEHEVDINATDNCGLSAVFLASHFGCLQSVKVLLGKGADASLLSKEPSNFSPIMAAACKGHSEVIQVLIEHGCNLNVQNNAGEDALDLAISDRKIEAVRVLLGAMGGADYPKDSVSLQLALANNYTTMKAITSVASIMYPSARNGCENPGKFAWMVWALEEGGALVKQRAMRKMLHAALEDQDVEWVKALAEQGCDMTALLESGHTPFTFAVGHRNTEVIQVLLNYDADPNKPNADGFTALDYAVNEMKDGNDVEIVDILLKSFRCRINMGNNPADTVFSYVLTRAEEWGSKADDLAIRMLASVQDINEDRDSVGCTLLHVATLREREDFIDLLLRRGADLETTDECGVTPLILATQHSPRMIPLLIERGANVNAKYKANAGVLAAAAAQGSVESLEFLVNYGLDIEVKTEKGYPPLACALTWAQEDAALFLIEQGADVHWKTNNKEQTALHFAAKQTLEHVVEELLKRDVKVNVTDSEGWTPLHEACATGNPKIVGMLLDAGADIEAELPNKDRPLHVALINEREEIAELLLTKGADTIERASKLRSPLHLAAEYGLQRAALLLLDKGCSTEAVDEESWTPLCCCGFSDVVRVLIDHGANVDYADKDNWTPLHQAVSNEDFLTAHMLLRAGAKIDVRTTDDGLSILERAEDIENREQSERFVSLLEEMIEFRKAQDLEANKDDIVEVDEVVDMDKLL